MQAEKREHIKVLSWYIQYALGTGSNKHCIWLKTILHVQCVLDPAVHFGMLEVATIPGLVYCCRLHSMVCKLR